jgi:alanine dehydrogenase
VAESSLTGAEHSAYGIDDAAHECAEAQLVDAQDARASDLVVKVKEPIVSEYDRPREETALFP